ncbi:LOW QUALITY PROTEIN: protein TIC 40, chloroplastic [Hevea brasiliensis]|uniref:LOW QUALITY PROTEIN: protein TIC 40, chloroplastic n=1 Tax=Hevea brasiliensis TaxID=3981 RepID=UPI0025E62D7C|nr:LOW QUALITY PROTEIN: protein TIC 40, chloroplastic [Hevea brasiliensis]
MENLNMVLSSSSSSSSPKWVLGYSTSLKNPTATRHFTALPFSFRNYRIVPHSSSVYISALAHSRASTGSRSVSHDRRLGAEDFASISSLTGQQTSSVGVNPQPLPPPSSQFYHTRFISVSELSEASGKLGCPKYAMQQAFKTMMNQTNTQNNQFTNPAFFPSPIPPASGPSSSPSYPTPSTSGTASSPSYSTSSGSLGSSSPPPVASQSAVTVDVPVEATKVTDAKDETKIKKETKKYAFVHVSSEETFPKSPFTSDEDISVTISSKDAQFAKEVSQNGGASNQGSSFSDGSQSTHKENFNCNFFVILTTSHALWFYMLLKKFSCSGLPGVHICSWIGKAGPRLSVQALEKMMEDPTVQKMVYPYLPEEMRNPATFKWMLQNPQNRQQQEEMLNNMSGSGEWDNRMMESLKNFDLNSPEVKQQFVLQCSQNPLSIAKYQNDKEVMDVFNKISELFPGVTGS